MSLQVINRNNVVAGLFLVLSIVLAVSIAFILSDIQDRFASRTEYIIRFPTEVGVTGLQQGAAVTFGGLSVGEVREIRKLSGVDPETGVEITEALDVVVALRSDLVVYEDAFGDLTPPMLGGVSRINIPSAGQGAYEGGPEDDNAVLDEGEYLRGRYAPAILTQMGFTTAEAEAIKESIHEFRATSANINEVSERFARMAELLEPEFGRGVDDGKSTMANLRALSERLGEGGEWSSRVDSVLARADEASGKIGPILDQAGGAVEDARGMISDNRERVGRIVENTEQITERFKTDTVDRIDALMEKGTLALGSYDELAGSANQMLRTNRPKIDATIDSVQDIGVQGRLFLEEIRSQPWRLLNKPSEEELSREPIYEAARIYASSVSDLRVASQALETAVQAASRADSPADAAEVARIAGVVEQAYERYSDAERRLLERLRTNNPTTRP